MMVKSFQNSMTDGSGELNTLFLCATFHHLPHTHAHSHIVFSQSIRGAHRSAAVLYTLFTQAAYNVILHIVYCAIVSLQNCETLSPSCPEHPTYSSAIFPHLEVPLCGGRLKHTLSVLSLMLFSTTGLSGAGTVRPSRLTQGLQCYCLD